MAKINISYDTESKALSVDVGGKSMPDATSFSFYKFQDYDGNWHSNLAISQETEMDGIRECLTVYAHKEPGMTESQKRPQLFEKTKSPTISKAISSIFKRKD